MIEERAVLAGGWFCGMHDLIRRYDGVISTRVGYSGGDVPNATYRNHGHCQTNLSGPAKSAGLRAFRPPADATRPGRQNGSV
jgi:hypothetical protein